MDTLKLPNGIIHDNKEYSTVVLKEMTGKQQNYLVNTKYKSHIDHIIPILTDLVHDIQDDEANSLFTQIEKSKVLLNIMDIEDIRFILIKIREISFGEEYFFNDVECPSCKSKASYEVKLDSLEVIQEDKCSNETTLPKSGKVIKYRPTTLKWLVAHAANRDNFLNSLTTNALLATVASIDGKEATREDIDSLSVKDLKAIAEHSPKSNHIDTKVTNMCKCGYEFDTELEELGVGFFVLSRA